jgi:hypothetical protein
VKLVISLVGDEIETVADVLEQAAQRLDEAGDQCAQLDRAFGLSRLAKDLRKSAGDTVEIVVSRNADDVRVRTRSP